MIRFMFLFEWVGVVSMVNCCLLKYRYLLFFLFIISVVFEGVSILCWCRLVIWVKWVLLYRFGCCFFSISISVFRSINNGRVKFIRLLDCMVFLNWGCVEWVY